MSDVLDRAAIERLLEVSSVMRLGCHIDGRTYVVPVAYVYDNGACYGHMSDGLKLRMLRANPDVCIEIEHVRNLASWESVIAWGTFEELSGGTAREAATLFIERMQAEIAGVAGVKQKVSDTVDMALASGIVYRIRLREKTGRVERGRVASAWFDPETGTC